jgi:hypothetical protein
MIRSFPPHPNPLPPGERVGHSSPQQNWGVFWHILIKGDHHIFYKEGVEEIVNLQPLSDGKAKAYQVKQVRVIIFKYKLHKGV